jgi:hypothetical protein
MDEQKEQKKKKIMFGLPGQTFSNQFIVGWTQFLIELMRHNEFDISLSPAYSPFSTFMRMKSIGLNRQEIHLKAFDGIDYDVFVSVDPTILFNYEQFKTLVNATEKHPVVSGIYFMNEKSICAIEKMDYEQYAKKGEFEMVSRDTIDSFKEKSEKMMRVEFTGLGFFACRRTVLQSLDYPYFWNPMVQFNSEDGTPCQDVLSDEVAFCRRIREKGFRIVIHTELKVLNEKQIIL